MDVRIVMILCCFGLISRETKAQVDTSLSLPLVDVTATRMTHAPAGSNNLYFDSSVIASRHSTAVTDLLEERSTWFIKSYGGGSLATSSVRGGSASHTAILWNGIPLENSMLGQFDLSLLPLTFTDQVTIQQGGRASIWGSGAVGGTMTLDNHPPDRKGWSAHLKSSAGSFGRWQHQLRANYKGGAFATTTRVVHNQAINDFTYSLREDLPAETLDHARTFQTGLMQNVYWTIDSTQELSMHAWWQEADRQIPPKTTQNFSEAVQEDGALRTIIQYNKKYHRSVLNISLAYLDEANDYRDPLMGVNAHNRFRRGLVDLEFQHALGSSQTLRFGMQSIWTRALSDGYPATEERIRPAVYASWRYHGPHWTVQAEGRQELADGVLLPFAPGLGLEYRMTEAVEFRGRISRSYRMPTLNDLYWTPGGNPELESETGWSQEIGIGLQPWSPVRYSLTFFNRQVEDWILWAPMEGAFFWSAQNLTKVHSRGLEQRLEFDVSLDRHHFSLHIGYDYIRSTNEIALDQPRIDKDEQLIYVPKHRLFSSLEWKWAFGRMKYNHRYTGSVQGQNERIGDYGLASFHCEFSWNISRSLKISAFGEIDNLWDISYRIIERYPMPGRHYTIGLALDIVQ